MSFLAILGLLFLLLIGKFIWDSFITGETDKKFEINKKLYPEETARLENHIRNGHLLNFNYKEQSSPQHRAASLIAIAESLGCLPEDAKATYQSGLRGIADMPDIPYEFIIANLIQSISDLSQQKRTQAIEFNIDPEDTPAALGELWAREVLAEVRENFARQTATQKFHSTQSPNMQADVGEPVFGLVTITDIYKASKGEEDGDFESIVVYSQKHKQLYSQPDKFEAVRTCKEYWEASEMVKANDWNGLAIGDQIPGVCISVLSSFYPFYDNQLCSEDGRYYQPALEASSNNQPNDRNKDDITL